MIEPSVEPAVSAPKLSAKQRKAIKQAEDAPKSNQPGVIYVGYESLQATLSASLTPIV